MIHHQIYLVKTKWREVGAWLDKRLSARLDAGRMAAEAASLHVYGMECDGESIANLPLIFQIKVLRA